MRLGRVQLRLGKRRRGGRLEGSGHASRVFPRYQGLFGTIDAGMITPNAENGDHRSPTRISEGNCVREVMTKSWTVSSKSSQPIGRSKGDCESQSVL